MAASNGRLRNMTFNQTFESSLIQKTNDKFTVDKSLIKGIKQNDVSKIIDQGGVSGGVNQKQMFDQLKQVQGIVVDTRKKFDKIKSNTIRSEKQIQKLKSQKQILLQDQSKFNTAVQKQKRQLEQTQRMLEQVSSLMQAASYRKQIYGNLKDTVKHDLLVLKKRYFDKDVTLMRQSTKLKSIRNQHQNKMKLSKRCRNMLESVQKSVNTQQLQRTSKIQSFKQVLQKKQSNQQNRQIRQREIQQAMMSAMTDKLSQQKQWIKMLNTNIFLKGIFKSKMQRLMNRYNKIQLSFHKMKQATNLKDSNQFIQRFLNRQQTYGMLLDSISIKQKKLEDLKEQHEQLEKIHQNFLYKSQQFLENKKIQPNKKEEQPANNANNIIHQLNESAVSIIQKKQLMYQWSTRFLAAYNGSSSRDKILNIYPKTKLKQVIIQALKTMNKFISGLQAQEDCNLKINQAFLRNNPKIEKTMTDEMLEKNTRIKTLSTYENQNQDQIEDKDMAYDDISEADYIQYNRRAIKKSDLMNRKFRIKTKPN